MDDDDYYHPDSVRHVVIKFSLNPTIQLSGSSILYIYYTDNKKIYKLGPYGPNHCTNGTLAVRKQYANTHLYDETVTHAEEKSFLESYKNPMIQLDPMKVMLVISHSQNTFDKKAIREQKSQFVNDTSLTLKNFIRSAELRNFYASA